MQEDLIQYSIRIYYILIFEKKKKQVGKCYLEMEENEGGAFPLS